MLFFSGIVQSLQIWVRLKSKQGLRRCLSMFPLTRVPCWYRYFQPQPFDLWFFGRKSGVFSHVIRWNFLAQVRDVVSHGETEASSVHLASESESERKAKAMPKTDRMVDSVCACLCFFATSPLLVGLKGKRNATMFVFPAFWSWCAMFVFVAFLGQQGN